MTENLIVLFWWTNLVFRGQITIDDVFALTQLTEHMVELKKLSTGLTTIYCREYYKKKGIPKHRVERCTQYTVVPRT